MALWQNWDWLAQKAHEISDSITNAIDGFTQKCSEKLEQFKTWCKDKANEIKTYSDPIITKGSIVEINSGIKNILNNPLVIKCPKLCPSTK